jgi:hypothetical protein
VSAGLGDRHFDAVAGHLHGTLREIEVEAALIEDVMDIVAGTPGGRSA